MMRKLSGFEQALETDGVPSGFGHMTLSWGGHDPGWSQTAPGRFFLAQHPSTSSSESMTLEIEVLVNLTGWVFKAYGPFCNIPKALSSPFWEGY